MPASRSPATRRTPLTPHSTRPRQPPELSRSRRFPPASTRVWWPAMAPIVTAKAPAIHRAPTREIGPQHPPPARRRRPAIGEEQDGQPEQHDPGRPGGLGEQRHPAERQPAVPEPVAGHHVEAGVLAEREEARHRQDDPAERVARLPRGHHEPGQAEGGGEPDRDRAVAVVHALTGQAGQRRLGDLQRQQDAGDPPPRSAGDARRKRRPAPPGVTAVRPATGSVLAHGANSTPEPFRERCPTGRSPGCPAGIPHPRLRRPTSPARLARRRGLRPPAPAAVTRAAAPSPGRYAAVSAGPVQILPQGAAR